LTNPAIVIKLAGDGIPRCVRVHGLRCRSNRAQLREPPACTGTGTGTGTEPRCSANRRFGC